MPDADRQSICRALRLIRHNVLYLESIPRYPARMDSNLIPSAVKEERAVVTARDLTTDEKVAAFLSRLLPMTKDAKHGPVAALLPWVCDRLPSPHSRRAYASDLATFVSHMRERGIDPLQVTGDDLRLYKAALLASGQTTATVARTLSVLRGTYQQFGKRGLIPWERVRDIQSVESPRVEKNTTPCLSQQEAIKLLHAPDRATMTGLRDHAMLFVYFKTAARCSAVRNARIGDIERTDFDWYLVVREKGGKTQRKALLEAAPAVLAYVDAAGIRDDLDGPLFRPVAKDRRTLIRKYLDRSAIWEAVKRNARKAGLAPDRVGRRGIAVHSLRKTAITNALENGAPIQKVQQLAGHADIRTTQLYFRPSAKDSEDAARHIHIR
jgi:site-specific recombinase XerD